MQRKQSLWLALILCATALALAACGGSDDNSQDSGDGIIQLRYIRWGLPEEIQSEQELLRSFEAAHPGIKVKLEYASWQQYWSKLQAQLAAGSAPDVMLMGGEYLLDFIAKGQLEDLRPSLSQEPAIDLAAYYPAPVELFSKGQALYGLPRDCNTIGIYYNKTLFKEHNVPLPTADWTWDGLLAAARALTLDVNSDGRIDTYGFLAAYESIEENWGWWVWQNGGHVLNADRTACLLDEPAAIEALDFMEGLVTREKVSPTTAEVSSFAHGSQMFISGRLAMCTAGSWGIRNFNGIDAFEWDVAPLPRHKERAAPVNGLGYSIYAGSKHKEQALMLAKFLVSEPAQKLLAGTGTSIPAMRSVAGSPAYLDGKPAGKQYFLAQLDYGRTLPFTPGFAKWETAVRSQLELVWLGEKTMEQACKEATSQVNAILKEAQPKP